MTWFTWLANNLRDTMKDIAKNVADSLKSACSFKGHLAVLLVGGIAASMCGNFSHAQVLLNTENDQFTLTNQSPTDLIDVSYGERNVGYLAAGETWTAEAIPSQDLSGKELPLELYGRIKLSHWGDALNALPGNPLWARLHLQTIGLQNNQDTPMRSLLETHRLITSINALKQTSTDLGQSWLEAGPLTPLKAGILAYAARYAPVSTLLARLLPRIKPKTEGQLRDQRETVSWPEGYEGLPDPRSSIKTAIELHGTRALIPLLENVEWSKDRGFSDVQLAFALANEAEVIEALRKRGDEREADHFLTKFSQEKVLSDEHGIKGVEKIIRKMIQARDAGDSEMAISLATSAALLWYRHNIAIEYSKTANIICSYMDLGAQKAINEKQLLAAQAYLNLGQYVCFGHPFYRSRAAEFLRTRGDLSYFDFDLEAAIHWYRSAIWISDEVIDRVRLIDTLARLSIVHIATGEIKLASSYLKEAREQEAPQVPPPDSLMAANALMPTPNNKAQVGLVVLIFVLGAIALSQILRLIFDRKAK